MWAVKHFRTHLYGHECHVFTDHEALKSLLKTPHPSGKLARWGLALQELNLEIHYRPGRKNANAEALSRAPTTSIPSHPYGIVAALRNTPLSHSKGGERSLEQRQQEDPDLQPIHDFLLKGSLPLEDDVVRKITLTQSQPHSHTVTPSHTLMVSSIGSCLMEHSG